MTDHTQLRKLAEAVIATEKEPFPYKAFIKAFVAFQHATNPQAVIELLDENAALTVHLRKANDQTEHFEREWYLRGDEIERKTKLLEDAAQRVRDVFSPENKQSRLYNAIKEELK